MLFEPEWKGPIEGYVVNFLADQHWKIARTVPWDDAMQEAYVIFLRCKRKYQVEEAKHFMSLFKSAWFNHFTDMANEDTELRRVGPLPESPEGSPYDSIGEVDCDGHLAVLVEQAPREVALVLALFINAPQELLELALQGWSNGSDARCKNGGNTKINQLLGVPREFDPVKAVVDYFTP